MSPFIAMFVIIPGLGSPTVISGFESLEQCEVSREQVYSHVSVAINTTKGGRQLTSDDKSFIYVHPQCVDLTKPVRPQGR